MKTHNYQILTINAASAGLDIGMFWHCRICGGSFGPVDPANDPAPPKRGSGFLAGTPLHDLGNDCDKAKETIDRYAEMYPEYLPIVQRERDVPANDLLSRAGFESVSTKPRCGSSCSHEPTVTLTINEAIALRRAVMGDHFESKDIDSAVRKIDKAEEDLRFADY